MGNITDRNTIAVEEGNSCLLGAYWKYKYDVSDHPFISDPEADMRRTGIIKGNSSDGRVTYDYKTAVTFSANVPQGNTVQWYVDNRPSGNGLTLPVEAKDRSYVIKVVLTDEDGNKVSESENVIIKNTLWDKIVYFFKHLFNPNAYIKNQSC